MVVPNPPTPEGPYELGPNTYIENSTVTSHTFGVVFVNGDIYIDGPLSYGNGTLNQYNVTNSTVVKNVTFSSSTLSSSICLYGTANITLKNVWNTSVSFWLYGNSKLHLENCTLGSVFVQEDATLTVMNSSIIQIGDTGSGLVPVGDFSDFNTTYIIDNNSYIDNVLLACTANLHFKNSTIGTIDISYLGMGSILWDLSDTKCTLENCTVNYINARMNSSFYIYGTNVTSWLRTEELSKVILNYSTVANLQDGIMVYDDLSINNDTITGTNYVNMTQEFSSTVINRTRGTITVNNSADVFITNYSSAIFLFDQANVTLSNFVVPNYKYSAVLAFDNSLITCENISYESMYSNGPSIYTIGNSSAYILENSSVQTLYASSSGVHFVYNSSIGIFGESLRYEIPINNVTLINSTIATATLFGTAKNHIENCLITNLLEGVVCSLGVLTLNESGFQGSGTYYNQTTLINNAITTRILRRVEVLGTAQLSITDLHQDLDILGSDSSVISAHNSTFTSLMGYDLSSSTVTNCTGYSIKLMDESTVISNQNCTIYSIEIKDFGKLTMNNGTITYLIIENKADVTVNDTIASSIRIRAHQQGDYALKVLNSVVSTLWVMDWGDS